MAHLALWASADPAPWLQALVALRNAGSLAPACAARDAAKPASFRKALPLSLAQLEAWQAHELPALLAARAARGDAHLTQPELLKLVQWKTARAEWHPGFPGLLRYAAEADAESVQAATRAAFAVLACGGSGGAGSSPSPALAREQGACGGPGAASGPGGSSSRASRASRKRSSAPAEAADAAAERGLESAGEQQQPQQQQRAAKKGKRSSAAEQQPAAGASGRPPAPAAAAGVPSLRALRAALELLSKPGPYKIKGVGPATASAVLAAAEPSAPYMGDEAQEAAGPAKAAFTPAAYIALADALRAKAAWLAAAEPGAGWSACLVERCLWAAALPRPAS